MKNAVAYISKQSPMALAGAAAIVLGVGYLLLRQSVKDVGAAVGSAASAAGDAAVSISSGDNIITRNSYDATGNKTDAYTGMGPLGTLGAITNTALLGIPASIGETLGGWTFDLFGPK